MDTGADTTTSLAKAKDKERKQLLKMYTWLRYRYPVLKEKNYLVAYLLSDQVFISLFALPHVLLTQIGNHFIAPEQSTDQLSAWFFLNSLCDLRLSISEPTLDLSMRSGFPVQAKATTQIASVSQKGSLDSERLFERGTAAILQDATIEMAKHLEIPSNVESLKLLIQSDNDEQKFLLLYFLLGQLESAYGISQNYYTHKPEDCAVYEEYYPRAQLYQEYIKTNFGAFVKTEAYARFCEGYKKTQQNFNINYGMTLAVAKNVLEIRCPTPHPTKRYPWHYFFLSDGNYCPGSIKKQVAGRLGWS